MPQNLFDLIAASSNRIWLNGCLKQNEKTGVVVIVEAVRQRLRDLDLLDAIKIKQGNDTIEGRVEESLRVYRAMLKHKHGRNQAAGYTEREIKQFGPKGALIRTIFRGRKTDGLKALKENDRLDCSYEQIAIDFAAELPDEVVTRARETLAALQ